MSSGPSRPCVGVVVYAGDKRGEGIRGVQVPQGMVVGWVHDVFSGVSKERIRLERVGSRVGVRKGQKRWVYEC